MMRATIVLGLIAAIAVGIVAFQVWLSRRKAWWPGLILPVLSFLMSMLMVCNYAAYSYVGTSGTVEVLNEDTGEVLYQQTEEKQSWTLGDAAQLGLLVLVSNIPTFVLLGAYYIGREKFRQENLLKKMNIQDL